MMNNSIYLFGAAGLLLSCNSVKKEKRPNIIFILADDMGYGDLGCYGQQIIKTPNLDHLAKEGIRFTQFYAGCTVSAPSRCALITGKHMGHAYIRGNAKDVNLRTSDTTISEVFKSAGYTTGMFGKWGLGNIGTTGDPCVKGWDAFTGFTDQVQAHFYYQSSMDKIIDGKTRKIDIDSTKYSHDLEIEAAMDFIRENKDNPFFAYIPIRIPHSEFIVPQEDLKEYLDENGNSIFEEDPYKGGEFKPFDKPYAAYAGMISKLDRNVGEIIKLIKELGIDKNTIVIFSSDNGAEGGYNEKKIEHFKSNGSLKGRKLDLYEGGIRVPFIAWCPGIIPGGKESDLICANWDLATTFFDFAGIKPNAFPDGISFKEELTGEKQKKRHEHLYFEFGVPWQLKFIQAVRKGEWKLVKTKRNILPAKYELYNLHDDISETNDLSDSKPELVKELSTILDNEHREPELKIFDFSKLASADPIPSQCMYNEQGKQGALSCNYFKGRNFEKLIRSENDSVINYAWSYKAPDGLPDDGFTIRWSGSLIPESSGTYSFYTAADDGVRLWINNKLIIEDWKSHGVEINSGTIQMEKGKKYPIRFEYLEDAGGAEVRLGWKLKN